MADDTVQERALVWIVGGNVGSSSKAIWANMMGAAKPYYGWSHPHDPDDLSRCLMLLDLIPEWRPRLPEMAKRSDAWAGLVARWDEIVTSFKDEFGDERNARIGTGKTYKIMRSAIGQK